MAQRSVENEAIQSVSTRIRLDGGAGECSSCGADIEAGERFKVAAVEDGGQIVYQDFCGGDCIDDWDAP